MGEIFPKGAKLKKALSIQLFGNRIFSDQTFEEYLLEFLLVFTAAKNADGTGRIEFHKQVGNEELKYYTKPQIGLKRFIFYDKSKQDSRSDIDTDAFQRTMKMLQKKSESEEIAYILQDLLFGYALVLKNRGWYAQSLLPIAPELIFQEALGIKERQKKEDPTAKYVENNWSFDQHDFLARGGEMYYLHLLQGLCEKPECEIYRERIEKGIRYMLTEKSAGFSLVANKIQNWWLDEEGLSSLENNEGIIRKMTLGYLQPGFARRADKSLSELAVFLSNEIHPITKLELLNKGMMLALLRSMHLQAFHKVNGEDAEDPAWVIDMRAGSATSNIGKLSAQSYRDAYSSFCDAINMLYVEDGGDPKDQFKTVQGQLKHTAEVFKKQGKTIQLIIPPRGNYERFSLSEDLARFLVLAIIEPGHKMTLDTFENKLFEHYGMVIGPEQYRKCEFCEQGMIGYFQENAVQFQTFLKECGLLRDLSDATSIVENPYTEAKWE